MSVFQGENLYVGAKLEAFRALHIIGNKNALLTKRTAKLSGGEVFF